MIFLKLSLSGDNLLRARLNYKLTKDERQNGGHSLNRNIVVLSGEIRRGPDYAIESQSLLCGKLLKNLINSNI